MADDRCGESQRSVGDERLPALIATRAGQHHVDLAAAAPGADEPGPPVENRRLGTVQLRLLGGIWFGLVLTCLAPHDEANAGSSRSAEGHRRPRLRLAPPRASGVSAALSLAVAHIVSGVPVKARAPARAGSLSACEYGAREDSDRHG
jgi:hypothetical protein